MNRAATVSPAEATTGPVKITVECLVVETVPGETVELEVNRDLDIKARKVLSSGTAESGIVVVELNLDGENINRIQVLAPDEDVESALESAAMYLTDIVSALRSIRQAVQA